MEKINNVTVDRILSGDAKIEELNFSVKTHNVLMRQGINTILKLISSNENELIKLEKGNLGLNGIKEIKEKLDLLGIPDIHLGFDVNDDKYKEKIILSDILKDLTNLRNKFLKLDISNVENEKLLWQLDKLIVGVYGLNSDEKTVETPKTIK